jgi:hypothetical protein
MFFFGSPIYFAKRRYVLLDASTCAVPPYVTIINLAVTLAFGGRSLVSGVAIINDMM